MKYILCIFITLKIELITFDLIFSGIPIRTVKISAKLIYDHKSYFSLTIVRYFTNYVNKKMKFGFCKSNEIVKRIVVLINYYAFRYFKIFFKI